MSLGSVVVQFGRWIEVSHPEDGCGRCIRNMCNDIPDYTASQSTSSYSVDSHSSRDVRCQNPTGKSNAIDHCTELEVNGRLIFQFMLNRNSEEWERIHLAMDGDEWRAAVNTGMSLGVGFLDQMGNCQCLVKRYSSWAHFVYK
jgi:hypothetical protein